MIRRVRSLTLEEVEGVQKYRATVARFSFSPGRVYLGNGVEWDGYGKDIDLLREVVTAKRYGEMDLDEEKKRRELLLPEAQAIIGPEVLIKEQEYVDVAIERMGFAQNIIIQENGKVKVSCYRSRISIETMFFFRYNSDDNVRSPTVFTLFFPTDYGYSAGRFAKFALPQEVVDLGLFSVEMPRAEKDYAMVMPENIAFLDNADVRAEIPIVRNLIDYLSSIGLTWRVTHKNSYHDPGSIDAQLAIKTFKDFGLLYHGRDLSNRVMLAEKVAWYQARFGASRNLVPSTIEPVKLSLTDLIKSMN
jgi:hypothetical protein